MSAIRMDMRCVSSGPLNTDSSAALRVSVLPDLDVTGEFCTRENVIETGTRGAEARHGRAQCEADRRPPATDRRRIWLATRKLAKNRLRGVRSANDIWHNAASSKPTSGPEPIPVCS